MCGLKLVDIKLANSIKCYIFSLQLALSLVYIAVGVFFAGWIGKAQKTQNLFLQNQPTCDPLCPSWLTWSL